MFSQLETFNENQRIHFVHFVYQTLLDTFTHFSPLGAVSAAN